MGDLVPVKAIVELADQCWEGLLNTVYPEVASSISEAQYLALDSTRSRMMLGWRQILNARAAVKLSIEWYKLFYTGSEAEYLVQLTLNQIEEYVNFKQGNALCGNQD
jgi:CDP-glucose 4,6-dehydratase